MVERALEKLLLLMTRFATAVTSLVPRPTLALPVSLPTSLMMTSTLGTPRSTVGLFKRENRSPPAAWLREVAMRQPPASCRVLLRAICVLERALKIPVRNVTPTCPPQPEHIASAALKNVMV